ncbi:MAG TPA: DUF3192 domain-containing protein [Pseudomonadales bacterium]|nr:DUF3192 domain-containing protein [Pseudomonadales bacterium]
MRVLTLATFLPLLFLAGCVIDVNAPGDNSESDWQARQRRNLHAIEHMQLGKTRASVESELGDPDFTDSFKRNGSTFVVLYYRTRHMHDDGRTTKDETTPLVFADGSLVGWGESAIDHATAN